MINDPRMLGLTLVIGSARPTFKEIIAGTRQNLVEGHLAPTVIYIRKN